MRWLRCRKVYGRHAFDLEAIHRCAAQRLNACAATPAPTDCCSFVRQEAAQARSASTARPTRSRLSWAHCSRFNQRGERSLVGAAAAVIARCCSPCSAKLSHGSPTACMANPGRVCFTLMMCADMVGVWAGTEPQERSLRALSWTMRAAIIDGAEHHPNQEIDRD